MTASEDDKKLDQKTKGSLDSKMWMKFSALIAVPIVIVVLFSILYHTQCCFSDTIGHQDQIKKLTVTESINTSISTFKKGHYNLIPGDSKTKWMLRSQSVLSTVCKGIAYSLIIYIIVNPKK